MRGGQSGWTTDDGCHTHFFCAVLEQAAVCRFGEGYKFTMSELTVSEMSVKRCRSESSDCHESLSDFLLKDLKLKEDDEIITAVNNLISKYGIEEVITWRSTDKHAHTLIHVLVNYNKQQAIKALAVPLGQLNEQRASDRCTPLHLSAWKKNIELTELLLELGADPLIENKYGENTLKLQELVKRSKNICFLDLELTELPSSVSSSILEVAVVITDENLVEIVRREWVVSKTEEELRQLGSWHQKTFNDIEKGGNGLFKAVLSDTALQLEQVAAGVFEFVKENCPEKSCSLAGFSVHCDREVLKREIPLLYAHMSHQIIDVSTILQVAGKWQAEKLYDKPTQDGSGHRAMDDVLHSIVALKFLKERFFS